MRCKHTVGSIDNFAFLVTKTRTSSITRKICVSNFVYVWPRWCHFLIADLSHHSSYMMYKFPHFPALKPKTWQNDNEEMVLVVLPAYRKQSPHPCWQTGWAKLHHDETVPMHLCSFFPLENGTGRHRFVSSSQGTGRCRWIPLANWWMVRGNNTPRHVPTQCLCSHGFTEGNERESLQWEATKNRPNTHTHAGALGVFRYRLLQRCETYGWLRPVRFGMHGRNTH